ncbi:GNAT family N-acetyltransferase [Virgibacillus soli]|uniref:GNAT family N-acetyltransferase n=1 Tax=Paracerasibacillus soli TaxID=480284 RepID=UPI0035E761BB
MEWHVKQFADLSNKQLYDLLKARVDVFVVEQHCPYPEIDGFDEQSIHIYLTINGEVAANARIVPKGVRYPEVSIGRVLVTKSFRNSGYARELMQKAMGYIIEDMGETKIRLQAQLYLEKFYSSLGFTRISKEYVEDGIPHVDMIWEQL